MRRGTEQAGQACTQRGQGLWDIVGVGPRHSGIHDICKKRDTLEPEPECRCVPIVDSCLELCVNQGWTATQISRLPGMPSRKTIGQ